MIDPVVDVSWWRSRHDVVLADVRWYLDGRSGRAAYDAGHLPGAVFVDLERDLCGPSGDADGRHPLPGPAAFAQAMSRLGIGDDDPVVAYDDAGGVIAARLVWMLRVLGHPAALLDGGTVAYDGPLERAAPERPPAAFTARPWPPDRLAGIGAAAETRTHLVLDARDGDRYRGEDDPVDPRPGHIPGAVSVPCRETVDERARLLAPAALRRRFTEAGVGPGRPVISYCGSGVTACHTLLALEHAGLGTGRLYPGSYSQYSRAAGRPVATGPDPGGDGHRTTCA